MQIKKYIQIYSTTQADENTNLTPNKELEHKKLAASLKDNIRSTSYNRYFLMKIYASVKTIPLKIIFI